MSRVGCLLNCGGLMVMKMSCVGCLLRSGVMAGENVSYWLLVELWWFDGDEDILC